MLKITLAENEKGYLMKRKYHSELLLPSLVFLLVISSMLFFQFRLFSMMPGDIGDARLNNYFLENIYQFIQGNSDSLWHLPFFSPFPYILGFSDNLFGSAPVYLLSRLLNFDTDTSFQFWFLFGYAANFAAAYFALRHLKSSVIAATVGALIFSFALPTTAHAGHAQLHYRFGLPLAIAFYADFLTTKTWRYLLITSAWLVWQFYAGVYMGFFTLLLMATMSLTYWGYEVFKNCSSTKVVLRGHLSSWLIQTKNEKTLLISLLLLMVLLLLVLFYPYFQVSHLYGAKRSWNEIANMLPRLQSYFLSDGSFLWSAREAKIFSSIPMRHEHQMFIGMVPFTLALAGFFIGSRAKNGAIFTLMSGMLGLAILLTLKFGHFSLWYLLHKLPLASAIRAMTRLDQALLFPAAYLSTIAIDSLRVRYPWGKKAILLLIMPLLIAEASMTSMPTSTKESWRQRILMLDSVIPKNLPDKSILFIAQRSGPAYADELDAMWVSLSHHKKTMNGYSGLFPPNYDFEYGNDCAQIPRRVLSYLEFIHQSASLSAYQELISHVVPIGFNDCKPSWFLSPPTITSADRIYSAYKLEKQGKR